jgi:lipopolysaccharide transport system ATP-binding protein
MSDIAIRVENLSKLYRIGQTVGYKTLRESLTSVATTPLRRLRSTSHEPSAVSHQPNSIWALKDVSFEVKLGEAVGIIGRNGSGKTTLLKILSRITAPTEGYAEVHGRIGSLLEIGTGFHPELTGRENIYLNGAVIGMKKAEIEHKFDEIVAFAEIEKFLDTPVKRYSSGMYVRLAFSVAAHLEPDILLIDEVLAVGDAEFQKKCLGKMDDVAKGGRTVLFVSHNMASVQNLCARAILLESGQINMEGSVNAVIDKYLGSETGKTGEVCWASPEVAPGDNRVRLKAVRIFSEGRVTGDVDISKEFRIEIDYWNLQADKQRVVSIHLFNSVGTCLLTSANLPSASLTPDPWYDRPYPYGLFRTSCTIPGMFLNEGLHSISVFITGSFIQDVIIDMRDVLTFNTQDTGIMRKEYTGTWIGAVRPQLAWNTEQIESVDESLIKK